jgi:hypothetical protein
MRDKADRWTGPSDEFSEVDDHHAQAGDLPEFGKNLLQYWGFDKDCESFRSFQPALTSKTWPSITVRMLSFAKLISTGSYGAPPKPVSHSVSSMMDKIERNPDSFHKRDYLPLLKEVRQKLAGVIGASVDEVVMVCSQSAGSTLTCKVPNTTSAINLIINNTVWKKGDIILTCKPRRGEVADFEMKQRTVAYPKVSSLHVTSGRMSPCTL